MSSEVKVSQEHPELHHYTDRGGLRGIWETGVLYATRYDCLNDATEVTHLRDGLTAAAELRLKTELIKQKRASTKEAMKLTKAGGAAVVARSHANGFIHALYETTFRRSNLGEGFAVPFITSFCSHGKDHRYEQQNGLLSQWRGYGREERYALVFDTEKLEALLSAESERFAYAHGQFADVVYNDEHLNFDAAYAELVNEITTACFSLGDREPKLGNLFSPFLTAATRLKHRGFREEREVRIVSCPLFRPFIENLYRAEGKPVPAGTNDKQLHRRRRNDGSEVPYIRLFDWNVGRRLPITRIIVGPHQDQARLAQELRHWTRNCVTIINSETPFVG